MADGASAARGFALPFPKRPGPVRIDWRGLLPIWSPPAAARAVRATLVVPGMFALCDKVIGNLQMAIFAAFGGFATLVLSSFGGDRRDKALAHLGLALAGTVLIAIGTTVSSSTALAAIITVPVALAVFFAGVIGPNAAGGVTGALLAYVLPTASPGTVSMIPERLAGWWLTSVAATIAVMLITVPGPGDRLRTAASKLARLLGDQLDAALAGSATDEQLNECVQAKHELLSAFTATPFRPTGLAATDQAFANAVELLEWGTSLIADSMHERGDLHDAPEPEREVLMRSARLLGGTAELLDGQRTELDLEPLESARERSSAALGQLLPDDHDFRARVQLAFHAHTIALSVLATAADALIAMRLADPDTLAERRDRWYGGSSAGVARGRRLSGIVGAATLAFRHASIRSVWFVNSLRGALSLGLAVLIADLTGVGHAFWVVLGALSVLRTSASATGATALRALAGTVAGFVIGALLIVALGVGETALWTALPVAVLIAAYTPGTAPFAIGQAAFTVVVAVLFNLLVPVGWNIGVVRVEDVALGCLVSVVVGVLFWPRSVAGVVGNNLDEAFRTGADYLTQAIHWCCGTIRGRPAGGPEVASAGTRLDDALRAFLAEQGTKHIEKPELWRLVGGTMRLRLTAHTLAGLPEGVADNEQARTVLEGRTAILSAWYDDLAAHLGPPRRAPEHPLEPPDLTNVDDVLFPPTARHACYSIWVQEHLDHLSDHIVEMIPPADRVAEIRRRPWWR